MNPRIPTKVWDSEKRYKFTNNGQTLFLPAADYVKVTKFYDVSDGYYWSGTAKSSTSAYYLHLYSSSGDVNAQSNIDRYIGLSVRPVRLVEVYAATTTEGYNVENDFVW